MAHDDSRDVTPDAPSVAGARRLSLVRPAHLLALGFGTGLAPKAPGTAGTLVGVLLYLPLGHLNLVIYTAAVCGLFALGVWVCRVTARDLGVHDHPSIVWDEVVGYLVTMTAAAPGWVWVAVGFLLFRLFDILKPWPIRSVDRGLAGGLGIMLDDVLAGVYAGLCLYGLALLSAGSSATVGRFSGA
jgi:phosphatidylglycerophosphatase A